MSSDSENSSLDSSDEGTTDVEVKLSPSNFCKRCLLMLEEEKYTDVVFLVQDQVFKAHRNILAAQSDYFDRLLFGSMKEATSSEIRLEDTPPNAFKYLLGFMYSKSVERLDLQTAIDLYGLADRFLFDQLKEVLEKNLFCYSIDLSTVLPLLFFAKSYNVLKLYRRCALFVKHNTDELLQSKVILSLSLPNFNSLLSLDYLPLNESKVEQAVKGWMAHNNPTEVEKSMLLHSVKSRFYHEVNDGEGISTGSCKPSCSSLLETLAKLVHHPPTLYGPPIREITGLEDPLAISSDGDYLYVADHGVGIHKFDKKNEKLIFTFGEDDFPDIPFDVNKFPSGPLGVAVGQDGSIYASTCYKLYKFNKDGELIKSIGSDKSAIPGEFNNLSCLPGGIRVHNECVYVCDKYNHRVQIFNSDLNFVNSFGTEVVKKPSDIDFDSQDNIYIISSDGIAVFDKSHQFKHAFGIDSYSYSYCNTGVCVLDEYVYVTAKCYGCYVSSGVMVFLLSGQFVCRFGVGSPTGILVDSDGLCFVCDSDNKRILVY